jgi:type IV pilus assembly protein PilB
MRIGELLVAAGMITREQLDAALAEQASAGGRIGELLVRRGFVTEHELTQILSNQVSVAWVSLDHVEFTRELLSLVPPDVALELNLLPVLFRMEKKQKILYVAVDDPTHLPAMERIAQLTGMNVRPVVAPASEIRRAIRQHYFGESNA